MDIVDFLASEQARDLDSFRARTIEYFIEEGDLSGVERIRRMSEQELRAFQAAMLGDDVGDPNLVSAQGDANLSPPDPLSERIKELEKSPETATQVERDSVLVYQHGWFMMAEGLMPFFYNITISEFDELIESFRTVGLTKTSTHLEKLRTGLPTNQGQRDARSLILQSGKLGSRKEIKTIEESIWNELEADLENKVRAALKISD